MKVLIIDEDIPIPPNTGKRIRTYNLLRRLCIHHQITYITHANPNSDEQNITALEKMNISVIPVFRPEIHRPSVSFFLHVVKNLFSIYPFAVAEHCTKQMRRKILEIITNETYDLIHCESSTLGALLQKDKSRVPKIAVATNVESDLWKELYLSQRRWWKRALFFMQFKKMALFERTVLRSFETIIAVSERDANLLRERKIGANIAVVENGVDTDYFCPRSTLEMPNTLVFTGSLDWMPNQDAIHYFVSDILPVLRLVASGIRFEIIGRNPPKAIFRLTKQHPEIGITADVIDIRPHVGKSALYIVPLRIGGGTRIKLLEAMAMGKGIVSTSKGAEGLDVRDSYNILLADKPVEFACHVRDLLANPLRRAKMGLRAREFVKSRHDWNSLCLKQDNIWWQTAGMK